MHLHFFSQMGMYSNGKMGAHSYDFTVGLSRLLNTPDFTELNLIIQTEVEFYFKTKKKERAINSLSITLQL